MKLPLVALVCSIIVAFAAAADDPVPGSDPLPIVPTTKGPEQGGDVKVGEGKKDSSIRWLPTLGQTGLMFVMAETFRIGTQADTRASLKGPYFKDYIESLRGLGGWNDDDPPIANYVAHPIQGSACTWILVQNDPKGAPLEFAAGKPYWISRLKGMGWSAAYSTFYEVSPVGDAGIGNLGMRRDYKGAVDLVITPTVGLGWHLTEDLVDKYFIKWVESKTGNTSINALVRTWLNPSRSLANLFRFRAPWARDTRIGILGVREYHRTKQMGLSLNGAPSP